jgi:hypothetical protein
VAGGLSPQKRAAFTEPVRLVLARRGLDVVEKTETENGMALGDGLYEFRVRWAESMLLRVFFCTVGRKIITLFVSGYARHRTQRSPATAGDHQSPRLANALAKRLELVWFRLPAVAATVTGWS